MIWGFVWDVGGHVLFSRYRYFDDLLTERLDGEFIEHDVLLKKHNISELNANRYQVKEAIEKKIDEIVDSATTKRFNELTKSKSITASGKCFIFGERMRLLNTCRDNFTRHLYEKAGKMNREEMDLAYHLDSLHNVLWWFRNPEMSGIYIQGWLKGKFYPDFIVKTKRGKYFVLEYKGGHLVGAEDAEYKEKIGRKWQELAGKNYTFEFVTNTNISSVIQGISKS